MGAESKIEWTDHTFNPWWGCAKVSPGCKHCYAETFAKRVGQKVWGVGGPRRFFGAKHWAEPLKWAKAAAAAGKRARVFCASMADVFEDHPELEPERQKLWGLIRGTAYALDWLLLTKRPENILRMIPADVLAMVWVGATVEDQDHVWRARELMTIRGARVRFLSCEPMIGPVDLSTVLPLPLEPGATWRPCVCREIDPADRPCVVCQARDGVDWVIIGGESGPGARPFDLAWGRSLLEQCRASGVAAFFKQVGADPILSPGPITVDLNDRKGGDWSEWPADLRVRQFPGEAAA